MSEKKSNFFAKIKESKANRAALISTVMLVAAVVVIVAVTVATNRTKKDDVTPPLSNDTQKPADSVAQPEDTEKPEPEDTKAPSENVSKPVEDKLPSFVLPVKGVVQNTHDASKQVWSTTMEDYRVHLGVDIVTEENAPVYAVADGKISEIWEDVKMGYCIAIEHSGDCVSVYKNLGETLPEGIAEGVSVRSGQLIATVGNSAMIEIVDEPHLHMEMTVGGLSVNPLEYYDEKSLEAFKIDSSFGE